MSLILFSVRSMKLKEPLPRILVRGSYDFFAVSFWHVKTKNFSLSDTKVLEMVQDFGGVVNFFWQWYEK